MFRKSVIAVLLCMAVLFSAFAPAVFAETIVEIDTGDLWNNDDIFDDDGSDDNTGSGDNTGGSTDSGNSDNTIPGENVGDNNIGDTGSSGNSGGTVQVVPPKEDEKEDDKTTVLPTTGSNNKTEQPEEDDKKEELQVELVDFSDVKETDWFRNDVGTLAGMGVINGYPDGTFRPEANVTRAEFLKLLITLMAGDQLFVAYESVFDDVDPDEWYATYVVSAIVYGVIDVNDYGANFNPDKPITRREVAKLVVNALQVESGGFKTPYADTADHNITSLYGLGLMQGTVDPATGHRYFYPDTQITRAETAAVILRIYKLSTYGNEYVEQFMKDNNMPPLQSLYVPTTKNDFYNVLTNAWDKNQAFVVYSYDYGVGSEQMRQIYENMYSGFYLSGTNFPEHSSGVVVKASLAGNGSGCEMEIVFDSAQSDKSYEEMTKEKMLALDMASRISDSLFDGSENGREKADLIHDYILENIEYDYDYKDESYTAYGAFTTGKAVCQGYSSAFNMLCEASGVNSLAVANDEHMWNAVLVDGKVLFYDTTFDDNGGDSTFYKGVEEGILRKGGLHDDYRVPHVEMFI